VATGIGDHSFTAQFY